MKTIVGFLSRSHGLATLQQLLDENNFKIIHIFTHSKKPKSEDPERKIRDDFHLYEEICEKNNIPLTVIDEKNHKIECPICDYIIEVSWRFLIPSNITSKANILSFGIHRGKLPDYAGSEPIKQALMANEKTIVLSAHYLLSEIDSGSTLLSLSHPVNYKIDNTFDENIQRLRDEITPLFPKLALQVLQTF